VTAIRIRGLAERADSPERPLGPDVTVPESVPVRIDGDRGMTCVGMATLLRDDAGIWAEAKLDRGAVAQVLGMPLADEVTAIEGFPCFALAVRVTGEDRPAELKAITAGEVVGISLCRKNVDPDLLPYEIVG
jgi:hypothetical protein